MEKRRIEDKHEPEIVYSRSVKAGKRIYYLDVKKAKNEDLYLCITESKKRSSDDMMPTFEKHKVFLYKEDFVHFTEALNDVVGYVEQQFGTIEERQAWTSEEGVANDTDESTNNVEAAEEAADAELETEGDTTRHRKRGLVTRLVRKYRDKE